jgi:hypothetical protein
MLASPISESRESGDDAPNVSTPYESLSHMILRNTIKPSDGVRSPRTYRVARDATLSAGEAPCAFTAILRS